jgi:hypothetical protein
MTLIQNKSFLNSRINRIYNKASQPICLISVSSLTLNTGLIHDSHPFFAISGGRFLLLENNKIRLETQAMFCIIYTYSSFANTDFG